MSELLNNITEEAKKVIPRKKAFEWNLLPLKIEEGFLFIALSNKNNSRILNEVSFYTGLKPKVYELAADIILQKLNEIYPPEEGIKEKEQNQESVLGEGTNIEYVNQIIFNAIQTSASDIHFETFDNCFRIRYRIDGHLREAALLPKEKAGQILSRLKIMASLDISEKRRPQDGKIRYIYLSSIIDLRLSSLPTAFGEKIVLRILNSTSVQLDFNYLGLNETEKKIVTKNIQLPYGMILVTGPTGSGKSTTLYTALKKIHSIEKNIITIEDPIEYNLDGINQSQVKPDIGYDFASALRAFLRQDPDIIMVGEIRDRETAEIAIRASLTGHLVLSTLHTSNSTSAITRLIDMGVEPFLVASSLKLVIAQRLVRRLCSCKKKNYSNELGKEIYIKNGCQNCGNTGYKGRVALFEMLELNDEIAALITKNKPVDEIKQKALQNGFLELKDSGMEKLLSGITTYEEVLRETAS